jgi:hypothetical protein
MNKERKIEKFSITSVKNDKKIKNRKMQNKIVYSQLITNKLDIR